jgi:hypothetical protein
MSNHNYRLFVCKSGVAIFLLNLLGIALCAPARADVCNSSIEELRNYINSEGGLVSSVKFEIDSTSPYENAKYMAMIGLESKPITRMGGTATLEQDIKNKAFLNSPQSIRPYAVKIIRSCENVFRAGVYGHEFGISYALHPDDSIKLDECAPLGMNMPYPFGYTYCG